MSKIGESGMSEDMEALAMRTAAERLFSEHLIIKQRLKARFANVPADQSLVDELIMERRAAAIRE
jgi:hypothetical protein